MKLNQHGILVVENQHQKNHHYRLILSQSVSQSLHQYEYEYQYEFEGVIHLHVNELCFIHVDVCKLFIIKMLKTQTRVVIRQKIFSFPIDKLGPFFTTHSMSMGISRPFIFKHVLFFVRTHCSFTHSSFAFAFRARNHSCSHVHSKCS